MIIDTLNLNHIRIFECVFRLKSMTKAADELHMTQSGVSQHVKHLEDLIGFPLFDRIKQKLVPTSKASQLFSKISSGLHQIEEALEEVSGKERQLAGKITIGIPIEFGNALVLPKLAAFAIQYPQISYKIFYGFASEINDFLLKGNIDFAFVDTYNIDKLIEMDTVYHETLMMVASEEYLARKQVTLGKRLDKKFFESLDYIAYLDNQPILRMWLKHHYDLGNINLNTRATLMDVQGVTKMILNHLGVGIINQQYYESLVQQGYKIHAFTGSKEPLDNKISIAFVRERTQTPAILQLIKYLKIELAGSK
jgi:DNA-binding transcriptional LysR family regulator